MSLSAFTAHAFKIEIVPESQVVAQINASVSLTCRTTGCESPSFSWRTQIDSPLNGKVRSERNLSVLTMEPVSFGNEHSYLCTATCGARKAERAIEVLIYCECCGGALVFFQACFKVSFCKGYF